MIELPAVRQFGKRVDKGIPGKARSFFQRPENGIILQSLEKVQGFWYFGMGCPDF